MGRPTIFDSATPDATSWKRPLRPLLSWLVCRFASCSESAYATHTAAVIDVNQIRNVFTGISFYAQRHASPDSEPAPGEEYGGGAGWRMSFLLNDLKLAIRLPIERSINVDGSGISGPTKLNSSFLPDTGT